MTIRRSSPFSLEVAMSVETPLWFLNAPNEQWFTVPAINTAESVGMTRGMFTNFTGGGVDQDRKEFVKTAAGGHQINWENGTYALQLNSESPEWVRLVDDTLVPDRTDAANRGDGAYADGTPRAVHNWNSGCFAAAGRIWLPSMTGQYTRGAYGSQVWGLDRAALGGAPVAAADAPWEFYGHGIPESEPLGRTLNLEAAHAAFDLDTGRIWVSSNFSQNGNYPFWSIDTADGTITQYPSFGGPYPAPGTRSRRGSSFVVDGYWVIICPYSTYQRAYVIDLSDPTSENSRLISSRNSPSWPDLEKAGCVYHPATRRAYFRQGGTGRTVITLDVPADPMDGSYSWGTLTPSTGATPDGDGDYSHFNIVHNMGNGQSALIYAGARSGDAYMYKLPSARA